MPRAHNTFRGLQKCLLKSEVNINFWSKKVFNSKKLNLLLLLYLNNREILLFLFSVFLEEGANKGHIAALHLSQIKSDFNPAFFLSQLPSGTCENSTVPDDLR